MQQQSRGGVLHKYYSGKSLENVFTRVSFLIELRDVGLQLHLKKTQLPMNFEKIFQNGVFIEPLRAVGPRCILLQQYVLLNSGKN